MSNQTWQELGVNELLVKTLQEQGINTPTEVQSSAISALMENKDIAVKSQTGSGKTLAFLLPILQRIDTESKHIQAVILAPTQELAMQIVRVADIYSQPLGIRVQQLIGGAAVKRQIERLKQNPHLVVGTPGRMNELVKSKRLKLHAVQFLIIDEADQTFELGSSEDIEHLLFSISKKRQTAFFSATYPSSMQRYEGRWMKEELQRIDLSPVQKVANSIEHYYIVCDQRSKLDYTRRVLRTIGASPALLFVNDTNQINNWESKLKYEGFRVEALYGDADKQRRASTLAAFREGKLEALLSTDVTARGIDISDLPLVIQIEPAIDADHYVHRAGRTGRMGKKGLVISIITPHERFIIDKFMKQLGITIEERSLFKGKLLTEAQISEAVRYVPKDKNNRSTTPHYRKQQGESVTEKRDNVEKVDRTHRSDKAALVQKKTTAMTKSEVEHGQKRDNEKTYKEGPSTRVKNDKKSPSRTEANKKNAPQAVTSKKKSQGKNKGAPKWLKDKWKSD